MRSSKSTTELCNALAKAQGEFPIITRDQVATFYDARGNARPYRYTSLGELLGKVRPVLAAHGIGLTGYCEPCKEGGREVVTRLLLGDQWMEHSVPVLHEENNAQAFGAALTYARRYGISTLLGIASEDDTDAAPMAPTPAAEPRHERIRTQEPVSTPPPASKPAELSPEEAAAKAEATALHAEFGKFHRGAASVAWRAQVASFAAKVENLRAASAMARSVVAEHGDRGFEMLDLMAERAGYVRGATHPSSQITPERAARALRAFLAGEPPADETPPAAVEQVGTKPRDLEKPPY